MAVQKIRRFDKLLRWMRETGTSQAALGRTLNRSKAEMSRLVNGDLKFIDPVLARAIERATGGAVTAADFIDFLATPAKRARKHTEMRP